MIAQPQVNVNSAYNMKSFTADSFLLHFFDNPRCFSKNGQKIIYMTKLHNCDW